MIFAAMESGWLTMEAIIKNIVGDMIANMENECVKVCQNYGFDVDKERLTRALTDARKFYDEGYRDGKAAAMDEIVRCKDCKHYEVGVCLKIYSDGDESRYAWQERKPDDFCSRGKRRSDDATD
jgi:hypothetical protein